MRKEQGQTQITVSTKWRFYVEVHTQQTADRQANRRCHTQNVCVCVCVRARGANAEQACWLTPQLCVAGIRHQAKIHEHTGE